MDMWGGQTGPVHVTRTYENISAPSSLDSIFAFNSLHPKIGAIDPGSLPTTRPRADNLSRSTQNTKLPRATPKETREISKTRLWESSRKTSKLNHLRLHRCSKWLSETRPWSPLLWFDCIHHDRNALHTGTARFSRVMAQCNSAGFSVETERMFCVMTLITLFCPFPDRIGFRVYLTLFLVQNQA